VVDNIVIAPSSEPGAAPTTGRAGDTPIGTAAAEAVTDAGITTKVKSMMLADPDVSGLRIDVDTRDGVVTLTGTVSTSAEKTRALDLAGKVENVKRVEDKLTVRPRT
jgi:hyperosmotically inducible protein